MITIKMIPFILPHSRGCFGTGCVLGKRATRHYEHVDAIARGGSKRTGLKGRLVHLC